MKTRKITVIHLVAILPAILFMFFTSCRPAIDAEGIEAEIRAVIEKQKDGSGLANRA